jgi:diguanylate cyclase (GGDEF)-like protein/PAS domain S-box-containing protein
MVPESFRAIRRRLPKTREPSVAKGTAESVHADSAPSSEAPLSKTSAATADLRSRPEILQAVQARAVDASILSSVAIIGLVVLYALVPGHYSLALAPLLVLAGIGGLIVVIGARLPWSDLIKTRLSVPVFFAWSLIDIALVSAAIALSGGSHSPLFLIYLVMCIFFAAVANPGAIRLILTVAVMGAYVITLAAVGWHIGTALILMRLGIILVTAVAAHYMSAALTRELYFRDRVTRLFQRRAAMWSRVAGLGREVGTLDERAVLGWVVDSVCEMGFEVAALCTFADGGRSYRIVQPRGISEEYIHASHSSDRDLIYLVREREKTVVVSGDDHHSPKIAALEASGIRSAVATPLWVDGEMNAVLVGGTQRKKRMDTEEVAAIELLAAHAGRGLETSRKLEHQRRDAAHFRSLITSAPDAMLVMDSHGEILESNFQVGRLFGYEPEELVGMEMEKLLSEPSRPFASLYRETFTTFTQNRRTLLVGDSEELRGVRRDGSVFPIEVVLGPIDAPEGRLVTATVRDVTERKEFEQRLAHQATHDHLTGLPNRAQFVGRLAEALARTPLGTSQIAVCFLDVDHFKYVNDSRGHTVGDQLVTEVGRRIASTARAGDLVARFGGDEFAVLVEGLSDRQGALAYAWRLLASFDRPFVLEDVECYLSASVGIAFGARGDNPDHVLRDADAAMYHAKQRGRARVELFDDTLTARAVERLEIESSLHQALLGEQLSLVFQPMIRLSDGTAAGVEALLRWEHPDRGQIPPLGFIPIAEETGLILQIGRWVMTRACQYAARWKATMELPPGFAVSVNVSNRQLEHDRLIAEVASILESSGLPPANLIVEVTESFFMRDLRAAVRRLESLKLLGVRIAIDDFGTGFSSLNSLARLPIDVVKIDKTFTDSLGTRNDAIIRAVVDVADTFELDVIAEGVESDMQKERLVGLGCAFAQGHLFGRPVPAAGVARLFAERAPTSR